MSRLLRAVLGLSLAVTLSGQSWTEDRGELGTEEDLLALGLDVADKVGAAAGPERSGPVLERHTESLSSVLRCPVCQGLSVADSPSESARNMKRQIRAMLAAGYDDDQIKEYFVGAYGEFVLMAPVKEGLNLVVWFAPAVILVVGGFLGLRRLRRGYSGKLPDEMLAEPRGVGSKTDRQPGSLGGPLRGEQATDQGSLEPWLAQVRAEAEED